MKLTNLVKFFSLAFLLGVFCMPLAGCGVSDEPAGVDEEEFQEEELTEEEVEMEKEI